MNSPHDLAKEFPQSVPLTCLERSHRIDILVLFRLRRFFKKRQPTIVVTVNLFPTLYLYLSGCLRSRQSFSTVVLVNKTEYSRGVVGRIRAAIFAWILKRSDQLIFGAHFQKDLWLHEYRLKGDKSTVIYNGVDTRWFSPADFSESRTAVRLSLGICDSDFVLVTVAGLRPIKNLSLLLHAVQRLRIEFPQVKAIFVGDGPERQQLQTLADDLAVSNIVHFVGNVEDVRPLLMAGDLFTLSSDSETFSNAALEAMSMGKAVVLPDKGGSAEMVQVGLNGWLFKPGSVDSLVDQVRGAINSPADTVTMGKKARKLVLEKFPIEKMLGQYERLFYAKSAASE